MRAVTIREQEIVIEEHPDPEPGAGEVLVRVHAAGLNGARHDAAARPLPAPRRARRRTSPGWSSRARSRALGPGAGRFAVGDRVMAIVGGGAQAELAVVHERLLMPVPRGARVAGGGRPAGGLHDGARRAVHAGRAAHRRASARARRRRRRRHRRDPARPRGRRERDATVRNEALREQVEALGAERDRAARASPSTARST